MSGHFLEFFLPYSKLFEELLCLSLDIFKEGDGGSPDSKNIEELFCLSLEIFQEGGGGGLTDSK